PLDVTIVDGRNHHTFQPLLYQVATAGLDGDDICFPVRGIFSSQDNARVRLGRVVGFDLDARTVELAEGDPLPYDHLILAAGAVTDTYGIPGVEEHAFGLKSLGDALDLRSHVLMCFERAYADPARLADGTLTIVIAGGGPTGVEMAGGLSELAHGVLRKDFAGLDLRTSRVVLVEAGDRLLAGFHPNLSERARNTIEKRGVEVMVDTAVSEVRHDQVRLADGTVIPAHTMIWTAGVKAHPLAEALGTELTKGGRVVVEEDLTLPGHPEVFVVGDMAASTGSGGDLVPQVAPVAMQGAEFAAETILARRRGERTGTFGYVDKGSMATIGRNDAVAQLPGGIRLSGRLGWLAWLVLHLVMLIGFRNRANVLVNWAWNYVTYDRASRIIPDDTA
ncbi:MAG: NAD(P)/FAD-dependent oxidoreductase, partial [Microthrixaceae bacterium]